MQNFLDAIRGRQRAQLPVRARLPRFDRVPHGGGKLSPAAHRALGRGHAKRSSKAPAPWISSTRRNRFNCAKRCASSPKPRSRRTSWSGTRRRPFPLEVIRKLGQLGYMGAIFPEELRRRGPGLHRVLHHHRRAVARGWLGGHHRGRAHLAVHQPHLQDGQRRAAAALSFPSWPPANGWAAGRSPSPKPAPTPPARAPRAVLRGRHAGC